MVSGGIGLSTFSCNGFDITRALRREVQSEHGVLITMIETVLLLVTVLSHDCLSSVISRSLHSLQVLNTVLAYPSSQLGVTIGVRYCKILR